MSSIIKYCSSCAITGKDMKSSPNPDNIRFGKGYLIGFKDELKQCPYCNTELEDIAFSSDDYFTIRNVSNYNRELLEAMIELKKKDVIEYELKMSQFRNQLAQQEAAKKPAVNIPKCPTCGSTNIKKISGVSKVGSVAFWGILAAGKVSKTYKCNNCGAMW